MSETKDCVCFIKNFLKLIANFKFVHCCHGNRSREDQTAKMVVFICFRLFFLKEKCSHQIYSVIW